MKRVLAVATAAGLLAACAQNPNDIAPTYTSPVMYQDFNCQQLAEEGQRVSAQAAALTGTQKQKASNDAVAMGVGLVLFWPALFFIKGDKETASQLALLRGQMDAIQQESIIKKCGITVQTYGAAAAAPAKPTAAAPPAGADGYESSHAVY